MLHVSLLKKVLLAAQFYWITILPLMSILITRRLSFWTSFPQSTTPSTVHHHRCSWHWRSQVPRRTTSVLQCCRSQTSSELQVFCFSSWSLWCCSPQVGQSSSIHRQCSSGLSASKRSLLRRMVWSSDRLGEDWPCSQQQVWHSAPSKGRCSHHQEQWVWVLASHKRDRPKNLSRDVLCRIWRWTEGCMCRRLWWSPRCFLEQQMDFSRNHVRRLRLCTISSTWYLPSITSHCWLGFKQYRLLVSHYFCLLEHSCKYCCHFIHNKSPLFLLSIEK